MRSAKLSSAAAFFDQHLLGKDQTKVLQAKEPRLEIYKSEPK